MNIEKAINHGSKILEKYSIRSAKLDSEILISKVMGHERDYILLNKNDYLNKDHLNHFKSLINQRSKGKPIAYLIGKKDFWNYEFKINNYVLVPRPDTELIIEEVLKLTKNKNRLKLLDIGVGSGCILLSILSEKKDFYGVGIDISKKCLDLSKINALNLGVQNRVKFFKTDVDNFFYDKYDLIISNPPYIKNHDLKYLEIDVAKFEPRLALDGGIDGLSKIIKFVDKSSQLLKKGGKLILEINFDQGNMVKKILMKNGFYTNKVLKDFGKKNRCIVSTKL